MKGSKLENNPLVSVAQADGSPLEIAGLTTVSIRLNNFEKEFKIYVAAADDILCSDGLLGMDVLCSAQSRLDFQRGTLTINGSMIQGHILREGEDPSDWVRVADIVTIPLHHEMVIDVMLEPVKERTSRHTVMMGRTLARSGQNAQCYCGIHSPNL